MMQSRTLSHRSSIATRAFAPSKPKGGSAEGMPSTTPKGDAAPKASRSISLQTHFVTEFGDELKIVTAPTWDLQGAIPMSWNDDHLWSAELEKKEEGETPSSSSSSSSPSCSPLEFKLVLTRPDGSVVWEEGPNRVIEEGDAVSALRVSWGFPEVEVVEKGVGGEEAEEAVGASAVSPAPEPAASVPSSSEAVLAAMSQFVKSVSPVKEEEEEEEEEAEEQAEKEEKIGGEVEVGEEAAPVASSALAVEEPGTETAASKPSSSGVQSAAAAAALGVGGALLATALAVDLTDAALLGAAAAAVAAATGSSSSPAARAASKAARAALEAPEKLLRAAGMKSFVEREAEAKEAAEAEEEEAEEE